MGPTRRIVSYPISVGIHSLRPQGIRLYQTKKQRARSMPGVAFMTIPRTVAHRLWLAYFLLFHLITLPVQFRVRETK